MKRVLLSMLLACSLSAASQNCISFLADIRNFDTLNWAHLDSTCLKVYSNGFSNAADFGVFAFRHSRVQLGKQMILKCAEKGVSRERCRASLGGTYALFADKTFSAEYDSVFNEYSDKIKENKEFTLLEKLFNIDQVVRIEYKKVMEKEAFFALLKTTDSLNYVILKKSFLNQASLYNESLIGLDGSYYLYLLLFHNLRHVNAAEFAEFEKTLHDMTDGGHFSANYFALIMDERLKAQGSSDFPIYNFHNVKTDTVKTGLINKNRKALGLKFLSSQ